MKHLFILLFFLVLGTLHSQSKQRVDTKLYSSQDFNKVTIEVSGLIDTLSRVNFSVFDLKGKKVKSIFLPTSDKKIIATVSIEDMEVGHYFYTLTKNKKRIYKGEFTKDCYDIL